MKEKEKAYSEAIEGAKKYYGNRIAEEIFHELYESEDDMIKTAILNLLKIWRNYKDYVCGVHVEDAIAWLEKQRDKDKLIQELGEYKVKYTQEVLEKYINSMSNKDDERLRKTAIAFLKDFAEQGYENAVECIDWLEKQGFALDNHQFINVTDGLPKQDEEVIVLCDELNTAPCYKIAFGHIVDKTICKDYNGWNIPSVVYWFPMPKLPKE